jgi:transcriptional regulator GlxA family with amidase domain
MSSFNAPAPRRINPKLAATVSGELRHGRKTGPADVRLLGGSFLFGSPDAGLLVSLLPGLVHVKGAGRLSALTKMVGEEAGESRAGRDVVLSRLVEVMLVEALRIGAAEDAPAGLLRGLSDARVAVAMRRMHGEPAKGWTLVELAKAAALSRSAFFDRFVRAVGMAPMEYLLAWRMALAKDMLRREDVGLEEVAARVGYGSASTFSTAFSRHVGQAPGRYARAAA